jgi:hypothetical protein
MSFIIFPEVNPSENVHNLYFLYYLGRMVSIFTLYMFAYSSPQLPCYFHLTHLLNNLVRGFRPQ